MTTREGLTIAYKVGFQARFELFSSTELLALCRPRAPPELLEHCIGDQAVANRENEKEIHADAAGYNELADVKAQDEAE